MIEKFAGVRGLGLSEFLDLNHTSYVRPMTDRFGSPRRIGYGIGIRYRTGVAGPPRRGDTNQERYP